MSTHLLYIHAYVQQKSDYPINTIVVAPSWRSPKMMLLVFLLAITIFLLFVLQKHRKNVGKNPPPGPPGLPIIGNIHQLDTNLLHYSLWELSQKYGPLMSLRLGFVPTLVISSARVAREAMKIHDLAFSGRPPLLGVRKLSYDGLDLAFAPHNDYWREMKKLCVVHLFNTKTSLSFHPIRKEETSRMIARISEDAASSKLTNLSDLVVLLTSDIICRVAFGKRYEEGGNENKRFHKLIDGAMAMMGGFFFQDYFPYMGWLDILMGKRKRLHQTFMDLDTFYQEIIDEHLDPQRPKSDIKDFVDILLGIKRDHLFSTELTLDHIKGVLMNVFIGGTDTISATLVWVMTMMMKNPRVLKKVQEEIRTNIGNKSFVGEDDIPKLPYFNAVVKETMRLYPAGPLLLPRETVQHCTIDGYDIVPQALVYVNVWAIGRDPEVWENPNEFYPERFLLGKSIDFKGQDYELIPFGAGRRICPGIQLGSAALGVVLSNLLYSFDWLLPPGVKCEDIDMTIKPGITSNKKIPLCLQAKIYNRKTPA